MPKIREIQNLKKKREEGIDTELNEDLMFLISFSSNINQTSKHVAWSEVKRKYYFENTYLKYL